MSSLERRIFSAARIAIALLGGGLLCLGVVVVFISTSTLEVRTEALQPILGDVIYAGFLTIAITVAMLIGTLWAVDRTERPLVPSPETVPLTPQFGAAFDRLVAGERPWVWSIATAQQRQRIRARLRDAAIGTIVRTSAASRETARRQVDRGAWTTDAEAAAFLGRTSNPRHSRLLAAVPGQWWFRRGARRTATAVADYDETVGTNDDSKGAEGGGWRKIGTRTAGRDRGTTADRRTSRDHKQQDHRDRGRDKSQTTSVRRTHRWTGALAVGLLASAVGVLTVQPLVLLAGAAGFAFAAYAHATAEPSIEGVLHFERSLAEETPTRGDHTEVTVTVPNAGDRLLPDVRIIDGVPPLLGVTDGQARHTAVLPPGAATSFTYEVRAERGTHRFQPATAFVRDSSGATEVRTTLSAGGSAGAETELSCTVELHRVPLRRRSGSGADRVAPNSSTSGVEFHRTRAYQRGDPMDRIDWNRFARTGDLTTVEFLEDRSTSVVVCLDARAVAYRSRQVGDPHAVAYGIAAAEAIVSASLDAGGADAQVGLAVIGREFCWLRPDISVQQRARAVELLLTHPTLSASPPISESRDDSMETRTQRQVATLEQRLSDDTQVVLLAPIPDSLIVQAALGLERNGHSTTVVSPAVTPPEMTAGSRLAGLERANRIHSLHAGGVPTVDWDPSESLAAARRRIEERDRRGVVPQ